MEPRALHHDAGTERGLLWFRGTKYICIRMPSLSVTMLGRSSKARESS